LKKKEGEKSEGNIVLNKLEDIDNKLERIKSDTHNLNRIISLSNTQLIIQELKKVIGKSEIRAATLYFTREEIGADELAKALGVDSSNLAKYVNPFLGNKGYIAEIKRGRNKYFQRSELVDLIGFESIEDFALLLKSFNEKRSEGTQQKTEDVEKEDFDVS